MERHRGLAITALSAIAAVVGGFEFAEGSDVPSVELPDGVHMPMLAFGSWPGSFKHSCSVIDAVKQWLELGGRHIDTANNYNTQLDVGRAMKEVGIPRSEIFLTTKIPGPIGKQQAIDMILNVSLPQLGVDYLDLVLIHRPCVDDKLFPNKCRAEDHAQRVDTWAGLLELKQLGKIRAAGVSNFDADQLATLVMASGVAPAVNQVEWHLGYHNETLLAAVKAHGVVLEAWGALTGPTAGNPGVSLSDPRLQEIAGRYFASTAQVALRWSVQRGVVPVTATCDLDHAKGDLVAFGFELSTEDIALLDGLKPSVAAVLV